MVRTPGTAITASSYIPHTRGDGPQCDHHGPRHGQYSPHAWGWSDDDQPATVRGEIFPTRVGMVRHADSTLFLPRDIPHTRGDGPAVGVSQAAVNKYSPHAWGWSGRGGTAHGGHNIFPTRVGMVRSGPRPGRRLNHIPHTRGDGPCAWLRWPLPNQYSPHAWGWSAS